MIDTGPREAPELPNRAESVQDRLILLAGKGLAIRSSALDGLSTRAWAP